MDSSSLAEDGIWLTWDFSLHAMAMMLPYQSGGLGQGLGARTVGETSEGNGHFRKTFVVGSLAVGFYSQKTTHRIAIMHAAGSRAVAFCGAHAFSFSKIPTRFGPLGI